MQIQTQFKLTTTHIRQRLLSIIDFHLQQINFTQQIHPNQSILLNQSLLEEWYEMLRKMVYLRQSKKIPTKATKITSKKTNTHKNLTQIKAVPPLSYPSSNIIVSPDSNYFNCYRVEQHKEGSRYTFNSSSTKVQFKAGFIHRFCSYNIINQSQILFIGGCTEKKTVKSADIVSFDLQTNQILKISQLPYGLSSHGSIKVGNKVYIVGGNRDPNLVTKKCLQFDIQSKRCNPIDQLHYASASHCLLNWKDSFVYKFGGMGSCFGQWDLSPYIERYNIKENNWELVNPIIKINESLIQHYSLLINSLAYVTNRESIVVLGGFDMHQEPSQKMFQISVREQQIEGQIQTIHQLINFGELQSLQAGGFFSQQPIFLHGNIFALQTQPTSKSTEQKLVRISNEVHYL